MTELLKESAAICVLIIWIIILGCGLFAMIKDIYIFCRDHTYIEILKGLKDVLFVIFCFSLIFAVPVFIIASILLFIRTYW